MRATASFPVSLVALLCLALGLMLPATPQAHESDPSQGLDREHALRASQAVIGHQIGDHTLLNREGRPVKLSSFLGKPLLVSFIYTGCFQVCPTTTRALQDTVQGLEKALGTQQFNVVSVGFNQPADSPQALKAFAAQFKITQSNWDFLSPPMKVVEPLARDFGFVYEATPAGFDHVLQVSLVDASGSIVRQIYGDRLTPAELGEPLKLLLSGGTVAPPATLDALLDRVRILCTVYDPKTGEYSVDYTLPLQVAGGLTFFIVMMIFLINEWLSTRPSVRSKKKTGRA